MVDFELVSRVGEILRWNFKSEIPILKPYFDLSF